MFQSEWDARETAEMTRRILEFRARWFGFFNQLLAPFTDWQFVEGDWNKYRRDDLTD